MMIGDILLGKLGEYRIEELIYRSKHSEVYKAFGIHLGVPVVIKLLPIEQMADKTALKRFEREAEALEGLDHPNIVRIYEVFQLANQMGIAMEYVEGQNLRKWLGEKKSLNLSTGIKVINDIGAALNYAHENGIIHRDIKPENILIGQDKTAKLSDFGIARFYEATTLLTNPNSIMGTPGYMAPEQYKSGDVDQRSDLFCLGLIFYEMLAGRSPYNVKDVPVDDRIPALNFQSWQPIKVSKDLGNRAPAGVKMVIQKALEIKRRKRHKSVSRFLDELERKSRPYLAENKNITVQIDKVYLDLRANSEPYDALLELLVVGLLTAIISNFVTHFSLALVFAIFGGSLAFALNLLLKEQGYAREWAWGIGSVIIIVGVLVSLLIPTDSGASVTENAAPTIGTATTATVEVISGITFTPLPSVAASATSTLTPVPTPTSTATSEPPPGTVVIGPAPPPAEIFVTQIDAIENDGCTSCGVRFELSVITNTLRPLPGAVVYIKQKNNPILPNSSRSGSDGDIATILFGDDHPLEFNVSHVLVNQGMPNQRTVPGDGLVINANPGDIIRATLKWEG